MLLAVLATLFAVALPAEQGSDHEAAWSELLSEAVTADGLVRYDLFDGPRREDFEAVAASIETFDARTLGSDAEKMAFWMNAYNIKLVERVLALGTPANIEAHGFDAFFKTPVRVAGHDVTLDQIEHVILRRQDGPVALKALRVNSLDPRLHVGLNCGAVSCPRLRSRAFTATTLNAELDRAMRDFANSPHHLRAEEEGFVLSSLLDWFADDFDATGTPAGDYLLGFMDASRPGYDRLHEVLAGKTAAEIKALRGVRFAYDWTLNVAR